MTRRFEAQLAVPVKAAHNLPGIAIAWRPAPYFLGDSIGVRVTIRKEPDVAYWEHLAFYITAEIDASRISIGMHTDLFRSDLNDPPDGRAPVRGMSFVAARISDPSDHPNVEAAENGLTVHDGPGSKPVGVARPFSWGVGSFSIWLTRRRMQVDADWWDAAVSELQPSKNPSGTDTPTQYRIGSILMPQVDHGRLRSSINIKTVRTALVVHSDAPTRESAAAMECEVMAFGMDPLEPTSGFVLTPSGSSVLRTPSTEWWYEKTHKRVHLALDNTRSPSDPTSES